MDRRLNDGNNNDGNEWHRRTATRDNNNNNKMNLFVYNTCTAVGKKYGSNNTYSSSHSIRRQSHHQQQQQLLPVLQQKNATIRTGTKNTTCSMMYVRRYTDGVKNDRSSCTTGFRFHYYNVSRSSYIPFVHYHYQQQQQQQQQQERAVSSTATLNSSTSSEPRRFYNPNATSADQQQQQQQQGLPNDYSMTRSPQQLQQRNPIVLTNIKVMSSNSGGMGGGGGYRSNNNSNIRYSPQLQLQSQTVAPPSTSSVISAQIPRMLSRLAILKHRHAASTLLSATTKTKSPNHMNQKYQQQRSNPPSPLSQPSTSTSAFQVPQLDQIFTNFNHGNTEVTPSTIATTTSTTTTSTAGSTSIGTTSFNHARGSGGNVNRNLHSNNNGGGHRMFSTTTHNGNDDDEIATDGSSSDSETRKSSVSSKSSGHTVLLYAVFGKRDFLEIQKSDFVERPMASTEMMESIVANDGGNMDDNVNDNVNNTDDVEAAVDRDSNNNDTSKEMVSFAVPVDLYSLSDIQSAAEEQFGTHLNLQFYHRGANEWRTLVDEDDLDLFQSFYFECIDIYKRSKTRVVVPIRIPDYYVGGNEEGNDSDSDEEENEDGSRKTGIDFPSSNFHTLEAMIEHLLQQLITAKWMCEDHHLTVATSATKDESSGDSDATTTTTTPKTKEYRVPRLMKEVTFDSKLGILDEESQPYRGATATTIPVDSIVAKSPATPSTSSSSMDTTHVDTATAAMETELEMKMNSGLISETTTIMPTEERRTVTKTYMYMNTKDYILSMASKDAALRGLLFYYPNALDHIVECLHYKFLWDNYYLKDLEPKMGNVEEGDDGQGGEGYHNDDTNDNYEGNDIEEEDNENDDPNGSGTLAN